MTLQNEMTTTMCEENTVGGPSLTVVLREHTEDDGTYYVAECLEIPGCICQGDTEEEARQNIEQAMSLCLSVMFEDCLKQVVARWQTPDLVGISSQSRLSVGTVPQLRYA
jgi:predicted RNase H-like HicB family nuclease